MYCVRLDYKISGRFSGLGAALGLAVVASATKKLNDLNGFGLDQGQKELILEISAVGVRSVK
jgi:hypothetical protein